MRVVSIFRDNAMFYKDLTQWLRNQTFLGLFILLLCLAWAASAFITLLPIESGKGGPVLFGLLWGGLLLFTLVILFQGYGLSAREFFTRTFELYELSGMSLERMILGKTWSLLAQFLFGFSCVVPFMFFAFLLGGIDFYDIVMAVLVSLVAVVPVFLATILAAVSAKMRSMGVVGRVILGLVLLYVLGQLFFGVFAFFAFGGGTLFSGWGSFIKQLVALEGSAWMGLATFLVFYAQGCLLLFYLACNAIAPSTDTREMPVKLLVATLTLSWTAFLGWDFVMDPDFDTLTVMAFSLYIILLLLGISGYYHRTRSPVMAEDRRARARRPFAPAAHTQFAPNAFGTLRTMVGLWLVAVACLVLLTSGLVDIGSGGRMEDAIRVFSYPLQAPYFLAAPAALFYLAPAFRRNPRKLRALVVVWWVGAGLLATIFYVIAAESPLEMPGAEPVSVVLGALASPISAAAVGHDAASRLYFILPAVRMLLGVVGLGLCWAMLWHRALEETRARNHATPAAATPAPQPDGLSSEPLAAVEKKE